jgi:hypothetical protein
MSLVEPLDFLLRAVKLGCLAKIFCHHVCAAMKDLLVADSNRLSLTQVIIGMEIAPMNSLSPVWLVC